MVWRSFSLYLQRDWHLGASHAPGHKAGDCSYKVYVIRLDHSAESHKWISWTVDGSRVNFFEEPGHVLTESLHRLDAFSVVFHFSGIATDPKIKMVGTRNNHLVDQEKIVQ